MENKAVSNKAHKQGWFRLGGFCQVVCVVFLAAIPTLAQNQSALATRPLQTATRFVDSTSPQVSAYTPMTGRERWQDYERTNFASYGAFFQAFFTGLGDYTGDV